MTKICLLGSTGSIGTSTLDVVSKHLEHFQIHSLVAGSKVELLAAQIVKFRPAFVAVATESVRARLMNVLLSLGLDRQLWPQLEYGAPAYVTAATHPDAGFVMSAIVGVAGLEATYGAVRLGKRIGLANKEVLVASGKLVTEAARVAKTEMIPVDSEHNGAHQCFRSGLRSEVSKLILTASGGPFRETPVEAFESITPQQALKHPTWVMGPRITIDSATMMNKGFEVIEACWLFNLATKDVEVVVHPQSCVHAMVEFTDGSVVAQASATDMKMPIQYALTYPERWDAPVPRLDWTQLRTWNFYPPDVAKFRLLKLSYQAFESGGSAACTLNAADEIAVDAFLKDEISFGGIAAVIEDTLNIVGVKEMRTVAEVLEVDRQSRAAAQDVVQKKLVRA